MLSPGARLGQYEILAPLGRGGMGEVHRARDTKLQRDVAIKVLPESFAADADRRQRLQREAQTLASLNHSHIGAIYDVHESPGVLALILELVDGVTLAEQLARGRLPIREALAIASQIAAALEAAHDKGIVHRDVKPSNVKVTSDGIVKVLDFGLARSNAGPGIDSSHSPTLAATREGELIGTVAYMSPEQARGRVLDKRTDIWAFGCVLFEMLTAQRAFAGDTAADTIAAILHAEPAWTDVPAATPPSIRRLLRRCLEKDLRRRQRDIGDARLEIDESLAAPSDAALPQTARPSAAREVRLRRLTDVVAVTETPTISPDGKMVAFVAPVDGRKQIWIRLLAGGAPLQITRDRFHHVEPRWSPDSGAIIFYSPPETPGGPGALWEVSALGGIPRRLATSYGGGDVSHDGRRIALFREGVQLAIVSRDGSRVEAVTDLGRDYFYSVPRWSPDDRSIAFLRSSNAAFEVSAHVMPVAGGAMRDIAHGSSLRGLSWLADGSSLVYSSSRGSTLLYPPVFNLRLVASDGSRDQQLTFGDVSYVNPDVDAGGRLVATRIRSHSDIWRFPIDGSPQDNTRAATRVTRQTGHVQVPSASPDGRQIVYVSDNGGHSNLWTVDTDGSDPRQITFEEDPDVVIGVPAWSPMLDRIAYLVARSAQVDLWIVAPDGSGPREVVSRGWAPSWSGDGEWLYYVPTREAGGSGIERVHVDRGVTEVVRVDGRAAVTSADGSAIYYARSLRPDIGFWTADAQIEKATPPDASGTALVRVPASRLPMLLCTPSLSPDGALLTLPLIDGSTANLWVLPTEGGPMRPISDFGDRSVEIVRLVSWSPDSRFLYAAVAETEADVVLLEGLLT